MATLVQSKAGGSFSGSVVTGANGTTSAVGFDNPTVAGHLLVIVSYAFAPAVTFDIRNLTTGGGYSGSWLGVAEGDWLNSPSTGDASVWYIANAPAMSTSQTTTIAIHNASGSTQNFTLEFDLYEFSGIDASPVIKTDDGNNNYITGGTPHCVLFPATTQTSLVIAVHTASGSNISAGAGYTLGINATSAIVGQMEYNLSVASGATSITFSGTESFWGCGAVSFSVNPASPPVITNVNPNSGSTIGGTSVTLTGTGFLTGATVSFGGSAATSVIAVSATSITCVTPAHAAGSVTVSITDSNGTGNLGNGYTYVQPPPVLPPQGQIRALTQVDTWELDNGMSNWPTDRDLPIAWWETTLPQQQIGIAKAPSNNGTIGLLYIALAQTLTGAGVTFAVPDDWTPYILYGTLAELLGSDGASFDPVRASYCSQRYQEGIELARIVLGGM